MLYSKKFFLGDMFLFLLLIPNNLVSNKLLFVINYFYFGVLIAQILFMFITILVTNQWGELNSQTVPYITGAPIVNKISRVY